MKPEFRLWMRRFTSTARSKSVSAPAYLFIRASSFTASSEPSTNMVGIPAPDTGGVLTALLLAPFPEMMFPLESTLLFGTVGGVSKSLLGLLDGGVTGSFGFVGLITRAASEFPDFDFEEDEDSALDLDSALAAAFALASA